MPKAFVQFRSVRFSYPSSSPLFEGLSLSLPRGWTGIVGANGAGKTTFLLLAAGILPPGAGGVDRPGTSLYCPQRTDQAPDALDPLIASEDGEAYRLRGLLGIQADWGVRWNSLSHGERKRAQIAAALWSAPDVLAIDEPTNHVDAEARGLLERALKEYAGIGLLVSHDRELLDGLCSQCLFLEPPDAVMRPGNYSAGREEQLGEEKSRRTLYERARASAAVLERQAAEKRREASQTRKRLSKKGIARGDKDSKSRIDAARLTGKDAVSGQAARRSERRLERAMEAADGLLVKKRYELGLWFESDRARRDLIFRIPAGELPLGAERRLVFPELTASPGDRIRLTGPNGCGKSTLVHRIVDGLTLPPERVIYLPQEMEEKECARIIEEARGLPEAALGRVLSVVNLLGSDPKRLLESATPSPGEARKLLIALGISRVPHLMILDEPTNHLDLPSIECLTEALRECSCALVLVSHDKRFVEELTDIHWMIKRGDGKDKKRQLTLYNTMI